MAAVGLSLAPIIIHLIHRRRYHSEPWAAMDFLLAAHQTTRRRIQLQHWVLMAVRCIVLLLLCLTVARPYMADSALGSAIGKARCDRVIILDDSLSMNARLPDGGTAFDAAKRKALEILDQSGDADGTALLTASTLPRRWMTKPVHDRQAVRAMIESLECGAGGNDLPGALRTASEILGQSPATIGGRWVYCLTDLTNTSIPPAAEPIDAPNVDRVLWIGVGRDKAVNIAISEFTMLSQLVGVGIPARYLVRLSNESSTPLEQASVEVLLDGVAVHRATAGPIPPFGTHEVEIEIPIPRAGDHRLTARLVGINDDLPSDDTRFLAVRVAETLPALFVDARNAADPTEGGLLYVAAALCGESADGFARFRGTTIAASDIHDKPLKDYSLIVVSDVPRWPAEIWTRLAAYVSDGGALMIYGGDIATADSGTSAGALLPGAFKSRTAIATDAEPLRFRISDSHHPALTDLTRHERGGLHSAGVRASWSVALRPERAARTLLSLTDGRPLLTEHTMGRGRIATWFTGSDIADCNLPAKPDFVPLMLNLATYLAAPRLSASNLAVGETWESPLKTTAIDTTPEIRQPPGGVAKIESDSNSDGRLRWICKDIRIPGFYSIRAGADRSNFAANGAESDSDLRRADVSAWRARFGPKSEVLPSTVDTKNAASAAPPREFATLFGFLLIVVVVIETVLASWFGSRG